jgi:hypothetical protein
MQYKNMETKCLDYFINKNGEVFRHTNKCCYNFTRNIFPSRWAAVMRHVRNIQIMAAICNISVLL